MYISHCGLLLANKLCSCLAFLRFNLWLVAGEGVLQPVDVAIVLLNPQVVVNAAEIAAETVLKITAPSQRKSFDC